MITTMPPPPEGRLNKYHEYTLFSIIFLLALLSYTAFQHHTIFLDCDSPWHIAAGDQIRALGGVPATDSWSFTAGDATWYNLSWLYDVWVSLWHEFTGLRGLVAINLIMAALIPCVLVKLCLVRGCSIIPTLIACILGFVVLKACLSVRPQQMSMLPAAFALLVLYQYRLQISRWIWALVPITIIWANLHGSYLVIFTMIGAFFLEALLAKDIERVKTYVFVGNACLVAAMVNPIGPAIYYGSWLSLGNEAVQKVITEWQPAKLSTTPQIFLYLVLIIALQFKARFTLPFADILLLVFWLVMAFNTSRHSVMLALFITPILAMMLTKIWMNNQGRLQKAERTMMRDFAEKKMSKQFGVMVLVVALVYVFPPTRNLIISDNLYDPEKYPVSAINYLRENHSYSNVFNTYCYGGYLIYQARGDVKPMMDSRVVTLFPEEVVTDYFDMLYFKPDWQDIAARYDVNIALFPNDDELAASAFKRASWEVIYRGDVASIYQKR